MGFEPVRCVILHPYQFLIIMVHEPAGRCALDGEKQIKAVLTGKKRISSSYCQCTYEDNFDYNQITGSLAAVKLEQLMYHKRLCKDIAKLSGMYQTSVVEAFHSLITRFALKMLVYFYTGMLCR